MLLKNRNYQLKEEPDAKKFLLHFKSIIEVEFFNEDCMDGYFIQEFKGCYHFTVFFSLDVILSVGESFAITKTLDNKKEIINDYLKTQL